MAMTSGQQQQFNNGNGRLQQYLNNRMGSSSSMTSPGSISISTTPGNGGGSIHDGNSPGGHQLYSSSCGNNGNNNPVLLQSHQSHMGGGPGSGHHHPIPRMPPSQHIHDHLMSSCNNSGSGGGSGKPHPLLSSSPGSGRYGPSPGCTSNGSNGGNSNGYFIDISSGYHGDCDDDRTPPTPMWPGSLSLSPPSARGGGMCGSRGSPPLRGHGIGPGGPGGLGYKSDRSRQTSLDEGRHGGGGLCGGSRNMRCHSDSAQMLVSPGCGGGGGVAGNSNGGDEFSLDLKKVSFFVHVFVDAVMTFFILLLIYLLRCIMCHISRAHALCTCPLPGSRCPPLNWSGRAFDLFVGLEGLSSVVMCSCVLSLLLIFGTGIQRT